MVCSGIGLHPGLDVAHRRASGPGCPYRGGELGLAAGTMDEHHQPPGDQLGHVGAEVLLDQGGCVDRLGRRVDGQLGGTGPVGGHPSSVGQTRPGGQERPRTHRGHPPRAGGGGPDPVDQHRVLLGDGDPSPAGQHQGVDVDAVVQQRSGAERQSALGRHYATGRRHHPDVVPGVDPEGLGRTCGAGEHLERSGHVQ